MHSITLTTHFFNLCRNVSVGTNSTLLSDGRMWTGKCYLPGGIMQYVKFSGEGAIWFRAVFNGLVQDNQEHCHFRQQYTFNRKLKEGLFLFQRDEFPVHKASYIKKWFSQFAMEELVWPAPSSINPIQQLWEEL